MPVYGRQKFFWYKEPLAEVNEDPPTIDTFYTCLDTTRLTKVWYIAIRRLDDDADAKALEVKTTIDGVTRSGTKGAANNNTWYYAYLIPTAEALLITSVLYNVNYYSSLQGLSVKAEIQTTDAPGANAELDMRVQYATWRPT